MKTELEHAFGRAFGRRDVTSPRMQAAIREWFDLYFGRAFPGEDPADRLPVLIVSKLCRAVFAEYESRLRPGGAKTDWMTGNLRALDAVRGRAMQAALVGGECLLKPVPAGAGFEFVPVRRDHFLPLGRDLQGRLQAVGTMQRISRGGRRYALLERRTAGEKGLTIETRLFELAGETLGREVPLDTLPETEALRPTLLLPGVPGVGLAVLRTPMANCVDGSPDPVAVFAPAAGLLHRLGRTEHGLSREFENGASRVFASEDLLRGEGPGDRALTDDLFVGLSEDPANLGVTVYSPALREQSYLARKQDILRGCESLIGLRRGTLCEAETAERTATEITATGADAVLTVGDFQQMWRQAVCQALALCDALGRAYGLCGAEPFDPAAALNLDWGDGLLYDRAAAWQEYRQMVADGLLRPELALAWYFGLPHETEADLAAVRRRWMPAAKGGDEDGQAQQP